MTNAEDKIEFASPAWIAGIRKAFEDAVQAAGDGAAGASFSISETYTDPPRHLSQDGTPIGWHCRIEGKTVQFEDRPAEDCAVRVVADYASLLPIVRLQYGTDPANAMKAQEISAGLVRDGKLRVEGAMGQGPAFLSGVHDKMAKVTA